MPGGAGAADTVPARHLRATAGVDCPCGDERRQRLPASPCFFNASSKLAAQIKIIEPIDRCRRLIA